MAWQISLAKVQGTTLHCTTSNNFLSRMSEDELQKQ